MYMTQTHNLIVKAMSTFQILIKILEIKTSFSHIGSLHNNLKQIQFEKRTKPDSTILVEPQNKDIVSSYK